MKVTKEDIAEAIKYLDEIEKGQDNMDLSSTTNGGGTENIQSLKSEMLGFIKKAKEIQSKIDELEKSDGKEDNEEGTEEVEVEEAGKTKDIKKAEEEEEIEDDGEEGEESSEEEELELDKEDIKKSIRNELFEDFKKSIESKDDMIDLLKSKVDELSEKIEQIENEPIKKSFTNNGPLSFKDRFEKAQSNGKTVVSKDLQKSVVSNHIFKLYEETNDEFQKSQYGEAIAQFESAGYLNPEIQKTIGEKYNLEII